MTSNPYLLVFALAFAGCVLAIPVVTRLAAWTGAIDRPDHYRRIHRGAIPRLGGLGLAWGIASGLILASVCGVMQGHALVSLSLRHLAIAGAGLIVLLLGIVDDTRGVSPRIKLFGQGLAVLVLYCGGVRIEAVDCAGLSVLTSWPLEAAIPGWGVRVSLDLPSLFITLVWFLGCMNVWNLIDGMDGLASGVGLLVSGTLMLVAFYHGNEGAAVLAAALAGSLAGFLLYNWHPACIFLGDCGSLLLGLTIGIVGVQGSSKGAREASLLLPVLAMGLPVTDTAMAIFRRWVRDLPLSSADRRHIHHLLIGLGLTPRQAAVVLYFFTAGLCGVVLLGVAWRSEQLALVLGVFGCVAFLLVLTSRRDELSQIIFDVRERSRRRRQERLAAKLTWDSIQKIELTSDPNAMAHIITEAGRVLGAEELELDARRGEAALFPAVDVAPSHEEPVTFLHIRMRADGKMSISVTFVHGERSEVESDIALRALQRLAGCALRRLEALSAGAEQRETLSGIRRLDAAVAARPSGRVSRLDRELARRSGHWLEPEPRTSIQG